MGGGLLALAPFLLRSKAGIVVFLLLVGGSVVAGMFGTGSTDAPRAAQTTGANATPDSAKQFVSFVLDDNQKNWQQIFARGGRQYRNAKLVLFTDATSTACGNGQAATGPFYCPMDERVYIDLSFFDELSHRFGAKGDFAQAYVIAHEVGHHVQKLLGTSDAVHGLRKSEREGETGGSVRLELQADCLAGVWAHSTQARGLLEAGDVDEALGAASAIGDDRLQKQGKGRVTPETFTHGTAAQRARWFKTGLERGEVDSCDTFKASSL
jgi:predicted metalloprotease